MNSLDSQQNKSLRRLERTIESGLKSFVEVGQALAEIRDSKLYRDTHKTFEAYCDERWNIKRQRAYQLIEAAEVSETVSKICDKKPNEAQAAELAKAPKEQQSEVWAEVVESTDKPTAAKVKEAVERKLPDRNKIIPVPEEPDDDFEPAEVSYYQQFREAYEQHCQPILDSADAAGVAAIGVYLRERLDGFSM